MFIITHLHSHYILIVAWVVCTTSSQIFNNHSSHTNDFAHSGPGDLGHSPGWVSIS
jgi:hypothetical protein